ncbi:hypothetical protein BJX65DRAFT_182417 [Aspergillus insuetus]
MVPEELGCQYSKDVFRSNIRKNSPRGKGSLVLQAMSVIHVQGCRRESDGQNPPTFARAATPHSQVVVERSWCCAWCFSSNAVCFWSYKSQTAKASVAKISIWCTCSPTNWVPSIRTYGLLSHGFRTPKGATVAMKWVSSPSIEQDGFQKPCHGCSEDSRHAGSHDFLRYSRVSILPHVRRKEEKVKTSDTKK